MGPSGQENSAYNALFGSSKWAANQGEQDITQSQQFMDAILSGDPAKIGQVLGPQERAIQQQGQQKKQTNAQFHNRGGGTNAENQTIGDRTTQGINDLISSLTGSAVSGLGNMGMNLFNSGQSGFGTSFGEANTMQAQNQAKWNDIFNSAASFAEAPFTGGRSLSNFGVDTGGDAMKVPDWLKVGSTGGSSSDSGGGWGF